MITYKIANLDNIQNYILGGRADFVVNDINNDDHINFKVKKDKKDETIYHVMYKSIDWVYIGHIKIKQIELDDVKLDVPIFYGQKNLVGTEPIAKVFKLLISYIYYIQQLPNNIEILYTGICSVCSRKLTDPKYIEIGIGPICLQNKL